MADTVLPKSDDQVFDRFIQAQGLALHAADEPPANRRSWAQRRERLRVAMFAAMGRLPERPCSLEPKILGVLKRPGYRVEKLIFQSRPDVWITASAYVPEAAGKRPAVLVVHGHWAGARRDPVVQARCLGLVKLGFFVLAVDAFGSGERYPKPALGTYHGALFGATLWPVGQTLLGAQVYDNRRAVDYLQSRPEVDGTKLGITGASGGGNQTMYAGSLDERFGAVVPVCSVGTYQAYLQAACCVCEVLPGGLRLAEEGDVLALVAPRALLVVNATRDSFNFSANEAARSLARARHVYRLYGVEDKVQHAIFESHHDYNRDMREVMYGWMTRWLKNEGEGRPIPEPAFEVDRPEDLACFPDTAARPKGFLFPPTLAAREARELVAKVVAPKPDHAEAWESQAVYLRSVLRARLLAHAPRPPKPFARVGKAETVGQITTTPLVFEPEPGMPLPALFKSKGGKGPRPACVLLHPDGKAEACRHPLAGLLLDKGWAVLAPDLRATGETRPAADAIGPAQDHNSAEHALWIGRPLLGQWLGDVQCLLDWLALQPELESRRLAVAGIGSAGVVALVAGGLLEERVPTTLLIDTPVTLITEEAYPPSIRMGILAPGLLEAGDVPQLAALCAPRRLVVAGGVNVRGEKSTASEIRTGYSFTENVFRLCGVREQLRVVADGKTEEILTHL